jgi:hypothetical protein
MVFSDLRSVLARRGDEMRDVLVKPALWRNRVKSDRDVSLRSEVVTALLLSAIDRGGAMHRMQLIVGEAANSARVGGRRHGRRGRSRITSLRESQHQCVDLAGPLVMSGPEWLDLNLYIASRDPNVVGADVIIRGGTEDLSRADIESCPVPWTRHLVTFDFSVGQRPFFMGACVIDGEEGVPNVEKRDVLAVDVHEQGCTRRDLARARDLHKFGHRAILQFTTCWRPIILSFGLGRSGGFPLSKS